MGFLIAFTRNLFREPGSVDSNRDLLVSNNERVEKSFIPLLRRTSTGIRLGPFFFWVDDIAAFFHMQMPIYLVTYRAVDFKDDF